MDKQSRRSKYNRSKTGKNKNKPTENENEVKNSSIKCDEKKDNTPSITQENEVKKGTEVKLEENVENCYNKGKFSKRHLVSNWDKYEEPDEEEGELGDRLRGSDFSEVISGGVGSVFRFKEDLMWEKEINSVPYAEEFFSLDIDDLSEAIQCISLPRRLLIDTSAFPRKMLNKLEAAAQKNSLQYIHKRKQVQTEEINKALLKKIQFSSEEEVNLDGDEEDSEDESDINLFSMKKTDDVVVEVAEQLNSDKSKKTVQLEEDKSTKKLNTDKSKKTVQLEEDKSTKKLNTDKSNKTVQLEEDKSTKKSSTDKSNKTVQLEEDKSTKKSSTDKSNVQLEDKFTEKLKTDSPNTIVQLEEDLDVLLSLDKKNTETKFSEKPKLLESASASEPKSDTPIKLFPESNPENLEDWLDTLLET